MALVFAENERVIDAPWGQRDHPSGTPRQPQIPFTGPTTTATLRPQGARAQKLAESPRKFGPGRGRLEQEHAPESACDLPEEEGLIDPLAFVIVADIP